MSQNLEEAKAIFLADMANKDGSMTDDEVSDVMGKLTSDERSEMVRFILDHFMEAMGPQTH